MYERKEKPDKSAIFYCTSSCSNAVKQVTAATVDAAAGLEQQPLQELLQQLWSLLWFGLVVLGCLL